MRISSVIDGLELEEIKNTELICVKCFFFACMLLFFFSAFRASMATQYWVLTISLVVVVGSVGVGLLFRCLRRRRQVISATRPQTIEIEEIGPMIEAAPLSPRRRKSERGSRSQSFESIELFSVNKKD